MLAVSLQAILARWLNNQVNQLPFDGHICHPCYNLLNTQEAAHERLFGHIMVCCGCGQSVRGHRYYTVATDSPILPILSRDYQDLATIYACRACWTRANRRLVQDSTRDLNDNVVHAGIHDSIPSLSPPPIPPPLLPPEPVARPQPATISTIRLPHYKRASNTSSHCIFYQCNNRTLLLIPSFIKRILIKEHNFYVPRSCRVCQTHLFLNEWHLLPQNQNLFSTFSESQVEDIINIAKSNVEVLDFNKVEEMPNNICHYWTGLSVVEFLDLYNSMPPNNAKQPRRALAIYFIKLRSGDLVSMQEH